MRGTTHSDRQSRVWRSGATIRIEFSGELDMATVPLVEDDVSGALEARPDWLVLDLEQVEFMDSAMLHLLVRAHETARAEGIALSVIRPSGGAARTFDLGGLGALLGDLLPAARAKPRRGPGFVSDYT